VSAVRKACSMSRTCHTGAVRHVTGRPLEPKPENVRSLRSDIAKLCTRSLDMDGLYHNTAKGARSCDVSVQ